MAWRTANTTTSRGLTTVEGGAVKHGTKVHYPVSAEQLRFDLLEMFEQKTEILDAPE